MIQRRFLVSIGLLGAGVGLALALMWPRSLPTAPAPVATAPPSPPALSAQEAADEARRAQVAAAFAELEATRKALRTELGDLKARVWGVELPAAQAQRISDALMGAQFLLKEPPMLGAFTDVAGVRAEQARVEAARITLRAIAGELGAAPAP